MYMYLYIYIYIYPVPFIHYLMPLGSDSILFDDWIPFDESVQIDDPTQSTDSTQWTVARAARRHAPRGVPLRADSVQLNHWSLRLHANIVSIISKYIEQMLSNIKLYIQSIQNLQHAKYGNYIYYRIKSRYVFRFYFSFLKPSNICLLECIVAFRLYFVQ